MHQWCEVFDCQAIGQVPEMPIQSFVCSLISCITKHLTQTSDQKLMSILCRWLSMWFRWRNTGVQTHSYSWQLLYRNQSCQSSLDWLLEITCYWHKLELVGVIFVQFLQQNLKCISQYQGHLLLPPDCWVFVVIFFTSSSSTRDPRQSCLSLLPAQEMHSMPERPLCISSCTCVVCVALGSLVHSRI